MKVDLSVKLGPLNLKNPVMSASGTFGYGMELKDFSPPEQLGMVITKGISLEPWPGNPSPRLAECAGGMMNAIGLENMGCKAFITKALPALKQRGAVVGANILGHSLEEYAAIAKALAQTDVDMLEVNVSCPNVKAGGLSFGSEPQAAAAVAEAVAKNAGVKPFMVKLSPMVADICAVALAVEDAGATAVSLINTVPAMAIDLEKRTPKLANIIGGLSGPAIKPVALRQVWLCAKVLKIPVVGLGGIFSARDALEFIVAGAAAIQIGTASLLNPCAPVNIIQGIKDYMLEHSINSLDELRGSLTT